MIVPQYWSESKIKMVVDGRQFTIKRFGWSDSSEQDAKAHADRRLAEALKTLETEGDVRRIDHKTSYNGAEGLPIREEVVARHDDVVISRNAYGALCLNTPDVLFADIDFTHRPPFVTYVVAFVAMLSLLTIAPDLLDIDLSAFGTLVVAGISTLIIAPVANRLWLTVNGGVEGATLKRIQKVSTAHPELNMRLYRTPMGFRVLVMNETFAPASDASVKILNKLGSDRIYVQMCKNQNCYRARVSPKPWRIGVERLKPRPGVWPINPLRMPERQRWVEQYDLASKPYASCRFVKQLGGAKVNKKAELVRQLHDEMAKSNDTSLQLA